MRIGLFGGTFNPIHLGHIQVVQEVKEGLAMDRIILIPSALPPHKEPSSVVDARDRMEMIRLAIADYPDFTVSDVELKRSGPSYTIDTVHHFKSSLSEDSALYLILGLDAFLEIDTWKSYMDLFQLVPFIVMDRGGTENNDVVLGWETLEAYLKSRISEGYQFSPSRSCHVHDEKQPIFVYNVTPINISSTQIRQLIKKGGTIRSLVPKIVEDFIKTKGLYL
jgi:nicotinate-nucleotide adenylyltransferase